MTWLTTTTTEGRSRVKPSVDFRKLVPITSTTIARARTNHLNTSLPPLIEAGIFPESQRIRERHRI